MWPQTQEEFPSGVRSRSPAGIWKRRIQSPCGAQGPQTATPRGPERTGLTSRGELHTSARSFWLDVASFGWTQRPFVSSSFNFVLVFFLFIQRFVVFLPKNEELLTFNLWFSVENTVRGRTWMFFILSVKVSTFGFRHLSMEMKGLISKSSGPNQELLQETSS